MSDIMKVRSGLGLEYRHFDVLDSTNDYLRTYSPVADITVVSASFQTKGRGQMGNSWVSDPGCNLLFSVLVLPTALKAADGFVLSQAMALAIKETIEPYVGETCVKWPNDIYCQGRKICGTLIENSLMGRLVGRSVIGSGINVNQTVFPDGLAAPATSMSLLSGRECSIQELLESVMDRFAAYYLSIQQGEYKEVRDRYHASLYLRGQWHEFQDDNGVFSGYISHVEPAGHIIIVDKSGNGRRYAFKQVKLVHSQSDF